MTDSLNAIKIIYDIIKTCGVSVFKDRSPRDQAGEHIIVGSNGSTNLEVVNLAQVNVNIYIPKPKGGMVNRPRIETVRTAVYTLIANATGPAGYYCVIDQAFSALLEDAKEGFDVFTIRYEITLNT